MNLATFRLAFHANFDPGVSVFPIQIYERAGNRDGPVTLCTFNLRFGAGGYRRVTIANSLMADTAIAAPHRNHLHQFLLPFGSVRLAVVSGSLYSGQSGTHRRIPPERRRENDCVQ